MTFDGLIDLQTPLRSPSDHNGLIGNHDDGHPIFSLALRVELTYCWILFGGSWGADPLNDRFDCLG